MIQVQGLSKTFEQNGRSTPILRQIDLSVPAGEFITIRGPSGCGKSTLLHILGALDTPDSGHIQVDGLNLLQATPAELAAFRSRSVGFVFQFFHLFPRLTVLENILLPAQIAKNQNADVQKRANQLLEQIGLSAQADHSAQMLSGGEMQRVCLARALINAPKILLADEPTGSLDSKNGNLILDLLTHLQKQEGLTLLLVTHDETIYHRGQRRLRMLDGKIQED